VKGIGFNYNPVQHGLDDEEIEFKRIIEESPGISDADSPDDDLDDEDLDQLKILENYRLANLSPFLTHAYNLYSLLITFVFVADRVS
jgi:hypothetical protein